MRRFLSVLLAVALIVFFGFLTASPVAWVASVRGQEAGVRASHGIASGDVTASTAVIWARTLGKKRAVMSVELSTDPSFPANKVRAGGSVWVDAATDYTGKVTVTSLTPGMTYYYRVWFATNKTGVVDGKF